MFNHHPNPHLWVHKMDSRCCLYCQFPSYCVWSVFQTRNGQKTSTINAEWVCHRKFLLGNIAHCVMSVLWKMRYWSVKSRYLQDIIVRFIDIIRINYSRRYDIQIFSLPSFRCDYCKTYFYPVVTNWWMQTLQIL